MTLARLLSTGSGKIEFRLEIEGWPEQFVSCRSMTGTMTDGRVRLNGLKRSGLTTREDVHLAEATLELSSMAVTIADIGKAVTASFTTRPAVRCYLRETIDDTMTSSLPAVPTGMIQDQHYHVGTEVLKLTSPDFEEFDADRGQWGSTAQYHFAGVGDQLSYPEITDRPTLMQGRRATLYLHGPTELGVNATGSVIWRGVVAREPRMDGPAAWRIEIDPLTSLLEQEVGAKIGESFGLLGIYYPWSSPLVFTFFEHTGDEFNSTVDKETRVKLTGFYRTQTEFCAALSAQLTTSLSSHSGTWSAVPEGENGWHLECRPDASSPKFARVIGGSFVDGTLIDYGTEGATGSRAHTFVAGTTYHFHWRRDVLDTDSFLIDDPRTLRAVPRAQYTGTPFGWGGELVESSEATTYTATRLYLARTDLLSVGSQLQISDLPPLTITALDVVDGYADLERDAFPASPSSLNFVGVNAWPVTLLRYYGGAAGKLSGFIASLIAAAPQTNDGGTPWLLAGDWGDYTTALAPLETGRPYFSQRDYAFTQQTKVSAVLSEMLKLGGCYLCLDSDARLTIRRLEHTVATDAGVTHIPCFVVSNDYGTVEVNPGGVINVVEIQTGYNSEENEFKKTTFFVRDVRSISRLKRQRTLVIAPPVPAVRDVELTEEATSIAGPVLSMYGGRYLVVSGDLPLTFLELRCGSPVTVSSNQLPYDGQRGLDTVPGRVIGREVDWERGRMRVRIQLPELDVAGYTPTARVLSQFDNGSNLWDLTVGNPSGGDTLYAPAGTTDASWFEEGDKVIARTWDDDTPASQTGEVILVGTNTLRIQFDGIWVPASSTWNVSFRQHADVTVSQKSRWAFIADEQRNNSDDTHARVFG